MRLSTHCQFYFLQRSAALKIFLEQRVTRREKRAVKKVSSLTFVAEILLNKKEKKRKKEEKKIEKGNEEERGKISNYSHVITTSSGSSFRCQFFHDVESGIVKCRPYRRACICATGLTNGADSFANENEAILTNSNQLARVKFVRRAANFFPFGKMDRTYQREDGSMAERKENL